MKKLFIIAACIFITSLVYAKTLTFPDTSPLFSIDSPEDWTSQTQEYILYITPYDESIYVGSWALPEALTLEDAVSSANEIIGTIISEPQFNPPQNAKFNGINFVNMEGKGKDKISDNPLNFSVSFFSPDKKKIFILLCFGSPELKQKHDSELTALVQSIKPIKS